MTDKIIKDLIRFIDDNLRRYAEDFDDEKKNIDTHLEQQISIINERTIAAVANYYLGRYLDLKTYCKLCVSELQIKLINKASVVELKRLYNEVDNFSTKKDWEYCYVDGFFKFNFLCDEEKFLFVEYKMNQKFIFLQLATDYLKYKIYTHRNNKNTIFAFVIFEKERLYPTILKYGCPYFIYLDKTITRLSLKESNVFIYFPKSIEEKTSINKLTALYKNFEKISYKVNELSKMNLKYYIDYTENDLVFLKNINLYDSKVIISNEVKKNYNFIYNLWISAKERFYNIVKELKLENLSEEEVINIIKDGSNYDNYYKRTFEYDLNRIVYQKKSNIKQSVKLIDFLVIFNFFFELTNSEPHMTRKKFSLIKDNLMYIEKNIVESIEFQILGLKVLYYLVNICPLVFVLSEKNEIIDKVPNNAIDKKLDQIQKDINTITKKIKYEKTINVKKLKNFENSEEDIIDVVSQVIAKL